MRLLRKLKVLNRFKELKRRRHMRETCFSVPYATKNKMSTTSHKAGRSADDRTTGVTGTASRVGLRGSSAL